MAVAVVEFKKCADREISPQKMGVRPKPPVPVNLGKEDVVSLAEEVVGSGTFKEPELWLFAK